MKTVKFTARLIIASALSSCALLASPLWAQNAVNPQDTIPDKMPFNIPFGSPIGLEKAEQVLNTAIAEANQRDWKMICTVVDQSGEMVIFKRMDNAQLASISISMHKARTAARYRRETKAFEIAIQTNPYVATLDDVIASRGGVPLVDHGKLIGAIGCSGGTGSQDELVAKTGAALINR